MISYMVMWVTIFLIGGPDADYFDCGDGIDVIMDFNLTQGDDRAGNCEEIIQLQSS